MKKLLFLLMFLPLVLSSCSSSDDDSPADGIVGTWKFDKRDKLEVKSDGGDAIDALLSIIITKDNGFDDSGLDEITFKGDGTLVHSDGHKNTYSISGDKLTITEEGEGGYTYIFTLDKKTLVLCDDDTAYYTEVEEGEMEMYVYKAIRSYYIEENEEEAEALIKSFTKLEKVESKMHFNRQ